MPPTISRVAAETARAVPTRPLSRAEAEILPAGALDFLGALGSRFSERVSDLLRARTERLQRLRSGTETLDFPSETAELRADHWHVPPPPADLQRRIVEITGPTDRKMMINALNSGADVFMADLEDANSPTWRNIIDGQRNLMDAVRRTISHDDPSSGKHYELKESIATLMVRPRGWHLTERHLLVDDAPLPAALVDAGLYLFHNAHELGRMGSGPYFYLPKLEGHAEAALWHDVLAFAEEWLDLPHGTVRVTVLIETLPAVFELDEILFALRERICGLNCGRWDYIFSFIKTRSHDPAAVLPDRSQVTMTQPCMRSYTQRVVQVCHRRGAWAIGGMAAQIPISGEKNPEANDTALARVRADKEREVRDGHDGTWVAHPALVAVAREAFVAHLGTQTNQLDVTLDALEVTAADLLRTPEGTRTEAGLRLNVRVGIRYLEAWLQGQGAVALYHLMEDAATAEISRAQVWQWMRHRAALDDGRVVTRELVEGIVAEEMTVIEREVSLGAARFAAGRFAAARDLFLRVATADPNGDEPMPDFLTLDAYQLLTDETTSIPKQTGEAE